MLITAFHPVEQFKLLKFTKRLTFLDKSTTPHLSRLVHHLSPLWIQGLSQHLKLFQNPEDRRFVIIVAHSMKIALKTNMSQFSCYRPTMKCKSIIAWWGHSFSPFQDLVHGCYLHNIFFSFHNIQRLLFLSSFNSKFLLFHNLRMF